MATFSQMSGYRGTVPGYIPPASSLDALNRSEQNVAADNAVIPIIYGRQRVQAKIATVTKDTSGNLVVLCVWCLGEVEGIENILVDNKFTSSYTGITTTNYLGSTSQTADPTLAAILPSYTDTLVTSTFGYNIGVCYSVVTVGIGEVDAFPSFEAIIKGRKVYDPRDVGQSEGTPSTWLYSTNPSLCLADFLKSKEYGWDKSIDYTSVETCADFNDEIIPTTSIKRHEVNIVIDSVSSTETTIQALRSYAHCFVVFDDGATAKLVKDDVIGYTPVEITEDTILDLALKKNSIVDSPTVCRVEYTNTDIESVDTEGDWKTLEAVAYAAGVEAGTTQRRETVISMYGYTEYNQAIREAIQRLNYYTLSSLYVTWRATDEALAYQVGDVVNITHSVGLTSKSFRITEMQPISAGRWNIIGQEYSASVYSDDATTQGISPGYVYVPDIIFDTTPDVPTGLGHSQVTTISQSGAVDVITTLFWDTNTGNPVSTYTIAYKNLTDGDTEFSYYDLSGTRIIIPQSLEAKSLVAKVRANYGKKHSAYTAEYAFSTVGDTTPPGLATGLSSTQGLDAVVLTWVIPTDTNSSNVAIRCADFSHVEIWWSATNASGTAIYVDEAYGTKYSFPELDPGLVGYFWLKSVDTSGNKSGFSTGASGSTSPIVDTLNNDYNAGNNGNYTAVTNPTVPSNAISYTTNSDGSIDATFVWSWAGTESTIDGFTIYFRGSTSGTTYTFGTSPSQEGTQLVSADKRSYVWRGIPADLYWTVGVQAYRKVTPKTGYLDGIIVSSLVKATGAGENPFRASATVAFNGQADTIAGQGDLAVLNAVDSAQIVSNAITAAKTSLAAINSSTGNLNANTVAASQIVANSITSTEIYSGYVYAGTINASQITTGTLTAVTINSSKYVYSTNYGTALPNGVYAAIGGIGTNTIGVYGSSTNDTGVLGRTTVSSAFATGVVGVATGTGTGIRGTGAVGADCVGSSYGCVGQSTSGTGVWAKSTSGTALYCNGVMTKSGTDWVQYLNADRVDNYHAGNSSGQVAVSNGTKCTNLNADKLDGYHARRNDNGTGAFIPVVDSNSAGIMEIGKYIDFHNTTSSNDYDVRVYSNSTTFEIVGNLHWSGTATGTYSSDITLKDNVKTIENALSNLCSIRGIEFDWVNGSGHDAGVSAQEVLKQFPYLVEKTFDGKLGVKYLGFTGIFIESIKELSAKVDTLTERLDKQDKLIEELLKERK